MWPRHFRVMKRKEEKRSALENEVISMRYYANMSASEWAFNIIKTIMY